MLINNLPSRAFRILRVSVCLQQFHPLHEMVKKLASYRTSESSAAYSACDASGPKFVDNYHVSQSLERKFLDNYSCSNASGQELLDNYRESQSLERTSLENNNDRLWRRLKSFENCDRSSINS